MNNHLSYHRVVLRATSACTEGNLNKNLNTHFIIFDHMQILVERWERKEKESIITSYYMTSQTLYRLWDRESYATLISMAYLIESCVLLPILCLPPKDCRINFVSRCITLHSRLSLFCGPQHANIEIREQNVEILDKPKRSI